MTQDRLTTPERMMALVKMEGLDRVPVNPLASVFAATYNGIYAADYFQNPQVAFDAHMWTIRSLQYDAAPDYQVPQGTLWDFGGEVTFGRQKRIEFPRAMNRIIYTEEDVYNLELPDLKTAPYTQKCIEFGRIQQKHGMSIGVKGGSMLELMQQLMGSDLLLRWLKKKPEVMHVLYRKITDYILATVDYFIEEFGAENLNILNTYQLDNNKMMSTKLFEEMSMPYIIELHEKCLKKGIPAWIVHLCGDHTASLDYWLKEIPLAPRTTFFVGSEMDIEKTAKRIGPDHIIAGNVPNPLLQTGTPNQVYQEARRIVELMKHNPGGFILMPDCALTPLAPPANVFAMIQAAKDFGRYE